MASIDQVMQGLANLEAIMGPMLQSQQTQQTLMTQVPQGINDRAAVESQGKIIAKSHT